VPGHAAWLTDFVPGYAAWLGDGETDFDRDSDMVGRLLTF
jgi:hypothetical protein